MPMQIHRTNGSGPPTGLAEGQLSVEMDTKNLWVGVPTSIDASGRVQLNAGGSVPDPLILGTPTGPAITGAGNVNVAGGYYVNGALATVPSGGSAGQLLIKGAGTAFNWAWSTTPSSWSTAFGSGALGSTATYSTAIGVNALMSNTGTQNVAIGTQCLLSAGAMSYNTAIGSDTLMRLTSGDRNLAIGYRAGRYILGTTDLTTSNRSLFIGVAASPADNAQTNQIVIGDDATGNGSNTVTLGNASTTALYLGNTQFTAVPTGGTQYQVLIKGTGTAFGWADVGARPNSNTMLGFYAFLNVSTGATNTAIGNQAMQFGNACNNNVAVGGFALYNCYGTSNQTAIGLSALGAITSGAGGNVAVGYQAGRFEADGTTSLLSATDSVFVGRNTSPRATMETNQIVIGASAIGNGSNTVTLGNASTTGMWLGGKQLVFGAPDSAGAGYRTVSIEN